MFMLHGLKEVSSQNNTFNVATAGLGGRPVSASVVVGCGVEGNSWDN